METYTQLLTELNEKIWNFSKLKFQEHQSADAMAELLRSHGFTVTMGLADMDTAFTATYGSGKPAIGLLAEFDALSGLSQCADVTAPCPRPETENGHGCGHNLLGTACVDRLCGRGADAAGLLADAQRPRYGHAPGLSCGRGRFR